MARVKTTPRKVTAVPQRHHQAEVVGCDAPPPGAGDSTTAGVALALVSGATLPEAALVGNLVQALGGVFRALCTTRRTVYNTKHSALHRRVDVEAFL